MISKDVLNQKHILILHCGRQFILDGLPTCLLPLPTSSFDYITELTTLLSYTLNILTTKICLSSPPGVWICGTDMLILLEDASPPTITYPPDCVIALSVMVAAPYACDHGIYVIKEGTVENILYQKPIEVLEKHSTHGMVPLVSSITFIPSGMVSRLIAIHGVPPIDACTLAGADSGKYSLPLSFYFDMLLACCADVTENDFVGRMSGDTQLIQARRLLWKELHLFKLRCHVLEKASVEYLLNSTAVVKSALTEFPGASLDTHSYTSNRAPSENTFINSFISKKVCLGNNCLIVNCVLDKDISIGDGVILYGLDDDMLSDGLAVSPNTAISTFRIHSQSLKACIPFRLPITSDQISSKGFLKKFLKNVPEACLASIWSGPSKSFSDAKLWPVLHASEKISLKHILWLFDESAEDYSKEVIAWSESWRFSLNDIFAAIDATRQHDLYRDTFYKISAAKLELMLPQKPVSFARLYQAAFVDGRLQYLLETLDSIARKSASTVVICRSLANISAVLRCLALPYSFLHSGPGCNIAWNTAFEHFEHGEMADGVVAMATEKRKWMERPDLLIRAARHYDAAIQILVRRVISAELPKRSLKPVVQNASFTVEAPARIDLAGGWSDTPPITYEHGGSVTGIAIRIDGAKPIGCRLQRIPEKYIIAETLNHQEVIARLEFKELSDLHDYNNPQMPGALLKSCLLYSGVIDPTGVSLESSISSGLHLQTWSNLPHGSGLGTSSILAGAVLAALWSAIGREYHYQDLIDGVLQVEQLMTTGGGWQDQVNGLLPGAKMGFTKPELPLQIDWKSIQLSESMEKSINENFVLVYTGQARLARNLLQNVIRGWYVEEGGIAAVVKDLVSSSRKCAHALNKGSLEDVGSIFSEYQDLKAKMAPGCIPQTIEFVRRKIETFSFGSCLAGAGGGGFLVVVLSDPKYFNELVKIANELIDGVSFYRVMLCNEGVTVNGEQIK